MRLSPALTWSTARRSPPTSRLVRVRERLSPLVWEAEAPLLASSPTAKRKPLRTPSGTTSWEARVLHGHLLTLFSMGASHTGTSVSSAHSSVNQPTAWILTSKGEEVQATRRSSLASGPTLPAQARSGYLACVTTHGFVDIFWNRYYITGAPQCVYPDANLGAVLNAVAFDAVYVQFCRSHV